MYADNRKEDRNSVLAVLRDKSGDHPERLIIDVKSVIVLFGVLLGVSLATVGAFALAYSLYLAIFFK